MFYTRINKIKVFNNREEFLGLFNHTEHYPHGTRDRQDVYDSNGDIQLDYTLFGFDKTVEPDS